MMKRAILIYLAASVLAGSAKAADQDECAIWLCLPTGFVVPGCAPAFAAMWKRKLEFKSPLPSFSSCTVDGKNESGMDYDIAMRQIRQDKATGERVIGYGHCKMDGNDAETRGFRCSSYDAFSVTQNGEQIGQTYLRNELQGGMDRMYDPEAGVVYNLTEDMSLSEPIPVLLPYYLR